jgi:hypothetical protein
MAFLKMTDKEIIENIYRKLDGELTAAELRELDNYLTGHPEVAQFAKEWELIKGQMESEPANPVDIDFKQEILKKINTETYKLPGKAKISIKRSFWSRPDFRSGSAFVSGVFMGLKNMNLINYDMKKQVKVIISMVVVIALLIVGISFFFPTVFKGLTSGTFGKAEKYHKQQMTEKDILLRSEFVNDTAQLRNMIQGLIYFSLFTQDLSTKIDSCVLVFKAQGLGDQAEDAKKVSVLQDYSDFIKNNNKTLGTTISMLSGFYLKDTTDLSQDVEKNLRDFGAYVNNLNEKDSVLSQALLSMDNFMLTNKTIQARKTEIARLKSIRDQLLVKSIQMAGILGNKEQVGSMLSYAMASQDNLNRLLGNEQLGAFMAQDKLQFVASKEGIQSFVASNAMQANVNSDLSGMFQSNQQVGAMASKDKLNVNGLAVIYDKPGLQFLVGDKAGLQNLVGSQEKLNSILLGTGNLQGTQVLAVFGAEKLNIILSNYGLQNVIQAQSLGYLPASGGLNVIILSQENLGFIGAIQGLNNMLGMLRSQDLGNFDPGQ